MPALDVFDRGEMQDLRGAMREGDYDTFTDLDPSGNDMSREDFEHLSLMSQAMELPEEETEAEKLKREAEEIRRQRAIKKREQEEAAEAEAERKKQEDEESSPFGSLKKSLFG